MLLLDKNPVKNVDKRSPEYLLSKFDRAPSANMMSKINYFFKPYSPAIERAKHMTFHDESFSTLNAQIKMSLAQDKHMEFSAKQEVLEYLQELLFQEHRNQVTKNWRAIQRSILSDDPVDAYRMTHMFRKQRDFRVVKKQKKRRQALVILPETLDDIRRGELKTEYEIDQILN